MAKNTEKNALQSNKDARKRYHSKTFKRIPLDVKYEEYDIIKQHTEITKEPVNTFIKRAIKETMENDLKTS